MKLAFYLIALAMIALALAVLLLPLMRQGRRMGRPRGIFALVLVIAFVLPVSAAGLYLLVGTPQALNGVESAPLNFEQALAELQAHVNNEPDDLQAWLLLAQTRSAMKQPEATRAAYQHALELDPDNTLAMIGWAESDATIRPDHLIQGRARALLERAVTREPENQRALWLLGISRFQQGRYAAAASTWRRLQPLLEPGSSVAASVAKQIAEADARAGKGAGAAPTAAPSKGPTLRVQIRIAPALRSRISQSATLFVYARAPRGSPMPLAVATLNAASLPASVTLTDAMAMAPGQTLSSVSTVFIGARLSASGQATAQPGDLQGSAGVVDVQRKAPIVITLNQVVPEPSIPPPESP